MPMKNLILLLAGMLCFLAAPPGAQASAPLRHPTVVYVYKATAAPVAFCEPVCTAEASAAVVSPAPLVARVESAASLPSFVATGAAVHQYLSRLEAALRVRPGWRGAVGSGFTRYQAPGLRYS